MNTDFRLTSLMCGGRAKCLWYSLAPQKVVRGESTLYALVAITPSASLVL